MPLLNNRRTALIDRSAKRRRLTSLDHILRMASTSVQHQAGRPTNRHNEISRTLCSLLFPVQKVRRHICHPSDRDAIRAPFALFGRACTFYFVVIFRNFFPRSRLYHKPHFLIADSSHLSSRCALCSLCREHPLPNLQIAHYKVPPHRHAQISPTLCPLCSL